MPCEVWRGQLDSYVDGELSSADMNALAEHLKECAGCAADALGRVQLKRSVALAGKRYQATAEFRGRVMQSVTRQNPRASASFWKILLVPALVLLAISVAVEFYAARGREGRDRVYSELTDLHVSTLASATPVDVVSTDRHTVKPWFEGKIPFTFNLPELQGTGFELVGGRVTYLAQTPGAQLIYRLRKHEISAFIFQESDANAASMTSRPLQTHSFRIEGWGQNGLHYFVIGDVGDSDIEALVKLFRDANAS
jgi:anti-sigma factor RsiW